MQDSVVTLCGSKLDIATLHAVAQGCQVTIAPSAIERMTTSNALILAAARTGTLVYGVTTGLGPQVTTVLSEAAIRDFSYRTIRGRAHAVGPPLSKELVRAAMAVRLNSLLSGASGASPAVAMHLQDCLNAGLVPLIGETASVGAADLLWGASMGLALIGEGKFLDSTGSSAKVMQQAGIDVLKLGPRDGLALASHSSFSAAIACVGLSRAKVLWRNLQLAGALTLEGFRGNLSPLNPAVLKTRDQAGQLMAAEDISLLLAGSALHQTDSARRLQDPLSIRNMVQVNGAGYATLALLNDALVPEINGATDNPIVLPETSEILSGGGYLNPYLGSVLVALNHTLVQMASMSVARSARMMSNRFTDLPIGLHAGEVGSVGLGAVTKAMDALFAEIVQLATPPAIYPAAQADSVEDCITNTALSAKALMAIVNKLNTIVAFEMLAAVHAIYLRNTEDSVASVLKPVICALRELSPALSEDRSLTTEIETLAAMLAADHFAAVRVGGD